MRGLKDMRILVTGASRGIGRAIVRRLCMEGAVVYANARKEESLIPLVEEGREKNWRCIPLPFDVSKKEEVKEAFKRIKDEGLQGLVNNAGIRKDSLLLMMKEEDWDEIIVVNLKSVYLCCKEAVRIMMRGGYGRIVNIVSVAGEAGNPGQTNYSASKGGIIAFTKSLAKELAQKNITVNAVSPGFIRTSMTESLPEEVKKKIIENIPLGRFGEPEDVAGIVAFLLSEEASYITGEVIKVNGGLYM
jgi:3-oxoacyl-[acyl-carrier protein] reductase